MAAFLTKAVSSATIQTISTILIFPGLLYVLLAGFVALGALRTLPSYGYGTQFLLPQKDDQKVLAEALARQETMNIIRHLRNETAYQALRNGFWLLLFVGILIFAAEMPPGS